jgi:Chlorophyll A-B binding protein
MSFVLLWSQSCSGDLCWPLACLAAPRRSLFWSQVVLMGQAEAFRAAGTAPGVEGLDSLYPGGPFDPLNLADDPDTFAELKVGLCSTL